MTPVDRPRRPDATEANRPTDQPASTATPADHPSAASTAAEPTARDAPDLQTRPETRAHENTAGADNRTFPDRAAPSAEPDGDLTASRPDDRHDDRADRPPVRSADDAAERPKVQQPADDVALDRDVTDRLPAELRDQMLRDHRFTRLGWGTDEPSTPISQSDAIDEHAGDPAPQRESGRQEPEARGIAASRDPVAVGADDRQEAVADFDRQDEAETIELYESESAERTGNADEAVAEAEIDGDRAALTEPADGKQTAAAADSDLPDTNEARVDEQAAEPTDHGLAAKADVAVPTVEREASGEDSLDLVDGTPDGADQDPDAADPQPVAADTRSADQLIRAILDRWDAETYDMPRPPNPDGREVVDIESGPPADPVDRRAVDERNGVAYVAAHQDTRPWLAPAAACEPVVQSIYASIDQGIGHAHIRHGAMGSDEMQARRLAFNEDPAQTDPVKKAMGIDGLIPGKPHFGGKEATRIHDATAFAAAYLGALEHPLVRAALERDWDEDVKPHDVAIPIEELLGPSGHELCSGFAVKGEWSEFKARRKQWVQARMAGEDVSGLPRPEVERIRTFEGGSIVAVIGANPSTESYEIYTMYPRRLKTDQES